MLVAVTLGADFGAQRGMAQGNAQILERPLLHNIADGQVAFPFMLVTLGVRIFEPLSYMPIKVRPGTPRPAKS